MYLDHKWVAAFTAASKVNNIATQTMPTLGTAAATYCGQNLGAGKYDRIFKGMRSCFWICIGCAVLAAAINCFVGPHMIGWFITSPTAVDMDYAMRYLRIASIFMLPLAWIFAYRNGLQGLNRGLVPMLSGVMELAARVIAIAIHCKAFWLYWCVLCRSGCVAFNRCTPYSDILNMGVAYKEENCK